MDSKSDIRRCSIPAATIGRHRVPRPENDFTSHPSGLGSRPDKIQGPTMDRLVDLSPDQLTSEQKSIFERLVAGRGRILGPYRVWIHSPTVASGMEQIGTFLNKRSSLSEREIEMVIVMIATHWRGDYVQTAHVRMGRKGGLSQSIIDALLAG